MTIDQRLQRVAAHFGLCADQIRANFYAWKARAGEAVALELLAEKEAEMGPTTKAAALAARVANLSAWNHTEQELRDIARARRNGAGLRITFCDGSAAFIPKGTAEVRVAA